MNLQTTIQIPRTDLLITHQDKIMMLGSCFAENLFSYMQESGFETDSNPFGILYNPASIAHCFRRLLRPEPYTGSDLFEHQGMFHSFDHHSRFSDISPDRCLSRMNEQLSLSARFMQKATVFIITFGTAYVYYDTTGPVVSNCHKLPDKCFVRRRLTVDEIVALWRSLISDIRKINPESKFLFTVSPIRHWKDGAHGNQLSKAALLLAIEEISGHHADCYYFPSYEIVMDELRDYRFYADDMLHPSSFAVQYIWEKFSAAFFDKPTMEKVKAWQKLNRALKHRPLHPDSEEYRRFVEETKELERKLRG